MLQNQFTSYTAFAQHFSDAKRTSHVVSDSKKRQEKIYTTVRRSRFPHFPVILTHLCGNGDTWRNGLRLRVA